MLHRQRAVGIAAAAVTLQGRRLDILVGMARRIVTFGALAMAALSLGLYRDAYGNWPWNGPPERLSWCGRTYLHAPGTTEGPARLHAVFRSPPVVGRQVFATVTTEQAAQRERAGDVCEFTVYLREDGSYAEYALSGGP
jgi:hypothetical protein